MISDVIRWLVAQGLLHDLVSAFVLVPIMRIMTRPARKIERMFDDARNVTDKVTADIRKDVRDGRDKTA